jgi:2-polyprenyl-3-methyl-5-hydroxy-6-metoxy-1,4-benzoquinol methylase
MPESANINDDYFDGHYKDLWKAIIPDILTEREINFILTYFSLQQGNSVLDIMCGYGRHALALGRKGINVTAVDNLPAYIAEIKEAATNENLQVEAIASGVLAYTPAKKYDLVMCMGNSLNFFNAKDTSSILSTLAGALKPGGHLLINSWSVAEIVFRSFKEAGESTIDGKVFANNNKILFQPTRMESESIITDENGFKEIKKGIDYIYSLNEMEQMLIAAGFTVKELFSIPGKKIFSLGEPRLYLIAQKR